MAVQRDSITVVPPDGETVVVDILDTGVSLGTVHAERATTRTLTLPLTITARTSFYVPVGSGPYDVSVKLGDDEIAGADGTPVTVSSFPAEIHARIDAAELGAVGGGSGGSLPAPSAPRALQSLRVNTAGNGFEITTGMGDFATWHREGAGDVATGGFAYQGDLVASGGSTITFDESTGWVTAYGYGVGMVTEAGAYFFRLRNVVPSGNANPNMSFYDAAAVPLSLPAWQSGLPAGDPTAADWIAVVHLPAGAHFEASYGSTASELTVLRTA